MSSIPSSTSPSESRGLNTAFRGRGRASHGVGRGDRGSHSGRITNRQVYEESDFTSVDKKVVQARGRGITPAHGSTFSKLESVAQTQHPKIENCASKNFRGRRGWYPSSHGQPPFSHGSYEGVDAQTLIKSLIGKREPKSLESRHICQTITQSRQMTFVEALQLLNNQEFSPNKYIYSTLLKKTQSWELIACLFQHIPDREKNDVIYNTYITACGKSGQPVEAKRAFDDAVQQGIADAYTYSSYISACGKSGQFVEAKKAFDDAVVREIADAVTYNSYIDACSKNGQPAEAKKVFDAAVQQGSADAYTYSSRITACGKNSQLAETKKAFADAVQQGSAGAYAYSSYISVCGKNGQFVGVEKAFNAAVQQGIADACIYNSYIGACGKNGQSVEAKKAFDDAVQQGIAGPYTYNSYIDACGKNDQPVEAKKAFDDAVDQRIADACTYNSYIDACGKNGRPAEAKKAFDDAVKQEIADLVTYSSYIDACGKNGEFVEAEKAFNTAVQQKTAGIVTYHIYIDLLVKTNAYEKACQIFDAGRLAECWIERMVDGKRAIDLHKFSHGSGFIAILRFVKLFPGSEFFIITGKGCKEDGNYLSFRNELKDRIERGLHLRCSTQASNRGLLYCSSLGVVNGPLRKKGV